MIMEEIRTRVVENSVVYLPKALATLGILSISTADFVDLTLRVIAGILGAVVTVWTIKRMSADIAFRKEEIREKRLANDKTEREIKRKYEK